MRIAVVGRLDEGDSADGVATALTNLVQALSERAHIDLEVWQPSEVSEVTERSVGGIPVFDIPSLGSSSILRGLPRATEHWLQQRRDRVDLLHLHSVFIPDHVWIARRARKPYVITPHGGYLPDVRSGNHRVVKSLWMRSYEGRFVDGAAGLHAVSQNEGVELARFRPHATIDVIPNGVEAGADLGHPGSAWDSSPKRFLYLGRLAVVHKGIDLLIRGFAQLVDAGVDARLVIAGPDFRGGRAVLEQLIAANSIASHVEFMGPVYGEAKARLLAGSVALVSPSRWDGMPLNVLEALAAGCPPIITPHTNLGDEVRAASAGLVVDADPSSIAEGLHQLLALSAEDYELMRKRGLELVRQHFTWSSAAGHLEDVYASALARNARAA